jgi:hypothetical protein
VPPRNAIVGQDDVRLRVPADAVRGPALELVHRPTGPHHEIGRRGLGEPGWREAGWREAGWREAGWREAGWREAGLGRAGLGRLPVRPVETLGGHVYKV